MRYITPLPGYTPTIGRLVAMLTYARETTLAAVEGRAREELNAHRAWFHVAADEISHRGHMRWLRGRLE